MKMVQARWSKGGFIIAACGVAILAGGLEWGEESRVQAQEFKNSIASTDFDFITADDPSTFVSLTYVERRRAELPDKRDSSLWRDAFVFRATFSDKTAVTIFVDAKFESVVAAQVEAERYVQPLGKLPTALRQGVERLCIHQGGPKTTAFSDVGLIVVYSENASIRIGNYDLEETIFHEAVHAAWDAQHAKSEGWRRAQAQDDSFITEYARSKPEGEDLAETALFAFTMLHHPERLPEEVRRKLIASVPTKIRFVGELLPPGEPIHFESKRVLESNAGDHEPALSKQLQRRGGPESLCDVRWPGIAADIVSHCLLTEFDVEEAKVQRLLAGADTRFESGEQVFLMAVQELSLPAEKLRDSILTNLHENCRDGEICDDGEIRAAVMKWKVK